VEKTYMSEYLLNISKIVLVFFICISTFSAVLSSNKEVDPNKEVEEILAIIVDRESIEFDAAFDRAITMGTKIIPTLMKYFDSNDCQKKGAAISLTGVIIRKKDYPNYEELLSKLLSIMDKKESEDRRVVASSCGALSGIKDVRVIPPIIEAMEYYNDIYIKTSCSGDIADITGNWKFEIASNDTSDHAKKIEEKIRKWYEENKGRMFFDERGKLRYGDPRKYKKFAQPSPEAIKGYIELVENLFGMKFSKSKSEILKNQCIFHFNQKEYEFIDNLENWMRFATEDEKTWEAEDALEAIISGDKIEICETPQAWFCFSYEKRQKDGIKDPAYKLIHNLGKDLFGKRYKEVLEDLDKFD
jgi:hypothetical protein